MYRYYFMAKNNIRKQKSDMLTFFILTLISSALIFISASFLTGTGRVIDTVMKKNNAADIIIMMSRDEAAEAKMKEIITGNADMGELESTSYLSAGAKYRRKGEKRWTEYQFNIASYEEERTIQKMTWPAGRLRGDRAVIPVSMSNAFAIGDIMELKIGDNIYRLKVAGYNEDNIFCSPMNLGTYLVYVSDRVYNEIEFENPKDALSCKLIKTKLTKEAAASGKEGNEFSDDLFNEFNDWYITHCRTHPGYGLAVLNFFPADLMRMASMILPFIFIAIVLAFAVIMFVIAMVIIHFSIKNFIMLNMKNTAIMEASGYTVRQMTAILLVQLLIVSGLGCAAGLAAGAFLIEPAGAIILTTLGLSWNQPVSVPVALAVLGGVLLVITLLTLVIGRDYKKTPVLDALHGIVGTKRARRNRFSFEHSVFPIPVTLALKDTFGKFTSKLGIIFIMMILTISTVFGFGLVDSYGRDDEALLEMSGLFVCDAMVDGGETMLRSVESMNTVESVYGDAWYAFNYTKGKRVSSITTRAFTDASLIVGGSILEGHWPENQNDIMLASAAADTLGASMGDTVTIKNSGKEENFRVCGLCQTMNNMGMMAYITMDGYERVAPLPSEYTLSITLKGGKSFADFTEEFEDMYPDVEVTDYREAAGSTLGMISTGMKAVAVFIAALTMIIVAFVESLIVRAQITREWRNLGVSKALGFTSGQLIVQTMLSNMPPIAIGVLIGLAASPSAGKNLMKSTFAIFGFRKATFTVLPISYALAVALIIGIAMATAALLGRRINSLEPVNMITEE